VKAGDFCSWCHQRRWLRIAEEFNIRTTLDDAEPDKGARRIRATGRNISGNSAVPAELFFEGEHKRVLSRRWTGDSA
jgi:hypothetical protein